MDDLCKRVNNKSLKCGKNVRNNIVHLNKFEDGIKYNINKD